MSNTALALSSRDDQQILAAIDAKPLAPTTKAQYRREVGKALDAGVMLMNASQVADYAAGLSKSSRSFLRAALRVWTKRIRLDVQGQATPDNMDQVGATLHRLDALDQSIELEASKGQKAHIWLTAGEVRRIMNSARNSGRLAKRDVGILALLLAGGLRRDELVNLRWKDIKKLGDRFVLDVKGKGAKARTIPISEGLAAIMDDWRDYCEAQPDEHVIRALAPGGGLKDSLTSAQVFNIVRKHGKAIGKPGLAPHDLRRTYAQLGYENGVPITQISILLGHSSVAVTQRYLNVELDLEVTASDFVPL